MSGLGLLAWYFGRVIRPSVLLLVSGAATGLVNPLYVWGDPGWYLSFLAFAGGVLNPRRRGGHREVKLWGD